ncbi:hypothetical protein BHM03_00005312 [Ensete ventricosum]|nr:hypothetical protein BHM03_00005312 [Ensete ventricosum]
MATDGEGAEAEARPQPSHPRPLRRTGDFLGKHRLSAAISRLNQEIQYLQKANLMPSFQCELHRSMIRLVILHPFSFLVQFLLTIYFVVLVVLSTPGPENPAWHRWFERVRISHSRKWWTHKGSSDVS